MKRGIEVIKTGFSVNIENDFKVNEKINAYIPTEKNIKLLSKIGEGILNKVEGSYLLSGAYGSGKSFFISVLLNLLSVRNKEEIGVFLQRVEEKFLLSKTYDKFLEDKYLVVFARDRFSSFEKAILHGILDTIKKENLKITLNIESEIILKKIEEWEENYSNIIDKISEKLEKKNKTLKKLKEGLGKNQVSSIKEFKDIYREIFYGEEFINYESYFDITKLLRNFETQVLEKTEYKGIVYVFDEFGRYLESNINKIDVKEVQDMAEYCNGENSSFMFLITHKDIFQYTSKLNRKENIFEWEKVTGRFRKEQLFYDKVTALNILSHSIYKTKEFKNFKEENKLSFERYRKNLLESGLNFQNVDKVIDEFYPLNYLSAYILPELSQKVAQNERTMFAFLNSNEEKGLQNILDDNFLVDLDKIYDYFEDNFKFLNHESQEYKSFYNTKKALNLTENNLERKLLKIIGVIEIYNRYTEISPKKEILKLALNCNIDELEELVKALQEKNIVIYRRNKGYFKIVEDDEINIENEIRKYLDNKLTPINYTEILNKILKLDFYYPVKYNYEKDITRYLKQIYIDSSRVDYLSKENEVCDGRIVYLTNILNFENYDEIRKLLQEKDILLVVNKNNNPLKVEEVLKELEAIEYLILDEKCMKNISLKEEYLLYKEELVDILKNELKEYFSKENIEVYWREKKFSGTNLLDITYEYLQEKFSNYIEINYELMNKEKLSIPMKKVRQTLVDMLIQQDKMLENEEFYEDTGAINSVARTVLKKIIDIYQGRVAFINSWESLEEIIISKLKVENYTLDKIYEDFTTDKNGYGLRKGIFTLFLGILIIKNKDSISIIDSKTKSKESLTSNLVEKIEKNPADFYLVYVEKNEEEEKYLNELKELLGVYFVENSDIEIGILDGIKNYFYSLNRYITGTVLKECKVLSKVFNVLFQDKNAHEFLFRELPTRARTENLQEVLEIIKQEIEFIEDEKVKFEIKIKEITSEVLGEEKELEEALKKWKEKAIVLDNGIKLWLKKYEYKNERAFLQEVTKKIKGFSYDNWATTNDIEDYKEKLDKFLKVVTTKKDQGNEIVEIISGEEKIIVPILKEHSQMGRMLKTKLQSTIKAMGLTVKDEEKKQILLEILKEM